MIKLKLVFDKDTPKPGRGGIPIANTVKLIDYFKKIVTKSLKVERVDLQ